MYTSNSNDHRVMANIGIPMEVHKCTYTCDCDTYMIVGFLRIL